MAIANSEHLCYHWSNNTSILPATREVTASKHTDGGGNVERDLYSRKELTMHEHVEDEVIYYYDLYPTEEDLMGETDFHCDLIDYLAQVLRWLFREHLCSIHKNLNFYQTADFGERPLVPDLAVIKASPTVA
jgi:hypothetical protein